jgi:hypothetical protein
MSAISDKYNQSELRNILGQPTLKNNLAQMVLGVFVTSKVIDLLDPCNGRSYSMGGILNKWRYMGWERSPLGYPRLMK